MQTATQMKLQLEAWLAVAEQNMRVLSRQIEIKKIEYGGSNRESNSNRQTPQPLRR